jgi:hypothetical protein
MAPWTVPKARSCATASPSSAVVVVSSWVISAVAMAFGGVSGFSSVKSSTR